MEGSVFLANPTVPQPVDSSCRQGRLAQFRSANIGEASGRSSPSVQGASWTPSRALDLLLAGTDLLNRQG